jgi:geranylgeranyl transferase type-2 subunit beta
LLSTFTALATLAGLDDLQRVNLPALARFLRQTALPDGGFKAAPADTEADIEYTYYGLGCLALLNAAVDEA